MKRLAKAFASTDIWWLCGALALGLALRLINLRAQPLWGDEILSWDVVRHFWGSTGAMLEYLKQVEIQPPLYYLFMRGWLSFAGQTELAVRLPSVLFGLGTIAMAWGWARSMFGRKTAAVAAFIVAILPLQIQFSQEARPYAMACFFSTAAAWAMWSHLRRSRAWKVAVYAAAQALAVGMHYAAILPLVAMATWWLVEIALAPPERRRALAWTWLAAHAVIFASFAWWLDAFLFRLMYGDLPIPGMPPFLNTSHESIDVLERTVTQVVWASSVKTLLKVEIACQTLFKLAAAALAVGLLRRSGGRGDARPWACLAWLAAGTLVLYSFSPQSNEYAPFYERQILFLTIPIALAIAGLLAALPAKRAAVLGAIFAISLIPRIADIAGDDALWDPLYRMSAEAAEINAEYRPGDLVIVWRAIDRTDLDHYLRPDIAASGLVPVGVGQDDSWKSRETLGYLEHESDLRDAPFAAAALVRKLDGLVRAAGARRVWLYGVPPGYTPVAKYFTEKGWRHPKTAIQPIDQLDLYADNAH